MALKLLDTFSIGN